MTESPVTLITGGGTGIGAAATRLLLESGQRVVITGRSQERLDNLASELGKPAELLAITADTSDFDSIQAAVDGAVSAFGRLDNVVANAGFATHDDIATGDPAGWRDMVLTNVLGPAYLIRASVAALERTKGRIVLVGSIAGHLHTRGNIYGATKWAVTGLAENTRLLVTEVGIGVTLISPGRVDTPFWDGIGGSPQGAILSPQQVAESIVWALRQPPGVDVNTVVVRPIGARI